MPLNTGFDKAFSEKYQDIRNKTLVASVVTNHRLESNLKLGKTVSRFKLDLSNIEVRDEVRYSDRTLDAISDSEELITVDQEKYLGVPLHKNDIKQNGPLKVAENLARQMRKKANQWLDGFYFSKVMDAYDTFDAGDIGGSDGAPIDMATEANITKLITLAPAKLKTNDVDISGNLIWVLDSMSLAYVEQMLIGKDIDLAASTFKNGYAGPMNKGKVYNSDNLTFRSEIDLATNPTANDTITIGGVVLKYVATPTDPGDIDIGVDAATSLANTIACINGAAGAGTTYIELSAANRKKLTKTLRTTASNPSASLLRITCIGAGRVVISDTLTAAVSWANARLHAYVGLKGAIDAVEQREVNLDVRPEPKQPVDNYFVDFLAGAKVFDDAKNTFLDLWIKA